MMSNCCGASPLYNKIELGRCSDCKENCEFVSEENYEENI